jgi:hypothetical protein
VSFKKEHIAALYIILPDIFHWVFFVTLSGQLWHFYSYKSILIRDLGFIGEKVGSIRYPPYNNANLGLFRALLKNRKVPDLDWIAYPLTFAAGVVTMFATKTLIDIF